MRETLQFAGHQIFVFSTKEKPILPSASIPSVELPQKAKVDVSVEDSEIDNQRQKVARFYQTPTARVIKVSGLDGEPFKITPTERFLGLALLGINTDVPLSSAKPEKYIEGLLHKAQGEWGWDVSFTAWTAVVGPFKAIRNIFKYKAQERKWKKSTRYQL